MKGLYMRNKLNGLTLNQARLLYEAFLHRSALAYCSVDDQDDTCYLLGQLREIIKSLNTMESPYE